MNKTCVYVVSSSKGDHFAEMSAVSMASLRLTNPDCKIIALIDKASLSDRTPGLTQIVRLSDRVIEREVDHPSQICRSRYLRVSMRDTVEGDILYLDSDTFVLSPLSYMWNVKGEVAGSPDMDERGRRYISNDQIKEIYTKLDWTLPSSTYINAGIVLMRDTPQCRGFCRKWREEWLRFKALIGKPNDQPAFNYALRNSDVSFTLLPESYNAQAISNGLILKRARIAHVFSGDFETRTDTVLHVAAKKLRMTGEMDWKMIKEAIARGHVWTELDSFRKSLSARDYRWAMSHAIRRLGA